jgi:hypothetical protein
MIGCGDFESWLGGSLAFENLERLDWPRTVPLLVVRASPIATALRGCGATAP